MFDFLAYLTISFIFLLQFSTNFYQIGDQSYARASTIKCEIPFYNASTPGLKEIFVGRCYYFINVAQKGNCDFDKSKYDCNKIWDTFSSITIKNTGNIEDYEPLFQLTDHPINENGSLFWSGTYNQAHQYSRTYKYWSLEDTFNGYLLDGLAFCPGNNNFSFDYCRNNSMYYNFWNAASRNFARKTTGSALVILNGSRIDRETVANSSTFNTYELPEFNSTRIKKLTVLLLHSPNGIVNETCKTGNSLLRLKKSIEDRNITYECNENPKDILFYMCFEDPMSKECQAVRFQINNSINNIANKFLLINLALILLVINLIK